MSDRRDKKRPGLLSRVSTGVARGAQQGALLGFADEVMGDRAALIAARNDAPVSYAVGEAIGSLPYAFLGSRAARFLERPGGRYALAAGLGGAHGAAFGLGAGEMEGATMEDRLRSAAAYGALGAGVGALSVPGARAAANLADNAPALLGRVRDAESGAVTQAAFGQGTRRSAPLVISLAGDGDPAARATQAVRSALSQDEALAMRADGKQVLGRFGERMTPFDGSGRSMRGIVDYAAQSAPDVLRAEADAIEARAALGALRKTTAPKGGKLTPAVRAKVADLEAAFDMPAAHESWLREARKLPEEARVALAARVVKRLKAGGAAADDLAAKKLKALGVEAGKPDKGLLARAADLRARAQQSGGYADSMSGIGSIEDRLLAARGMLNPDDAAALLAASRSPVRSYLAPPDLNSRMLRGAYERGMAIKPREWFSGVTPEQLETAVVAAQPAAALASALPFMRRE